MFDLKGYGWILLEGVQVTVVVAVAAMALAAVLGMLGAWAKLSASPAARRSAGVYTTVIRGIPELILLLLIYYGVPTLIQDVLGRLGAEVIIDLNPYSAGVVTIGFIYGAFATEVFRGAFLAVPKGQIEAARAAGMDRALVFRRVMVPQMWRFALPGLGNVWMVLLKATALMSVIQVDELMRNARIAAGATHLPFTFYFAASLFYLGLTVISMVFQSRAEAWADRGVRRA